MVTIIHQDVDWLNEEMLRNIEHFDEKNVLYQMGMLFRAIYCNNN